MSPTDQSRGIFSQTEIGFTAEKTTRVTLPRLGSLPNIPSAPTVRPTLSQPVKQRKTPLRLPSKHQTERFSISQLSSDKLDQAIVK